MRVGWLHDEVGFLGGAELSMAEFRRAAPKGVEIIDCPSGSVHADLDRYVVGNCMTYEPGEIPGGAIRYHHDLNRAPADLEYERHIFCSPLQRSRMDMEGECIPPAIDLSPFEAVASSNHRKGAVCVGRMAYGKGLAHLAEFSEPVDVYSSVPFQSQGNARYLGPATEVPATLAKYERFVFAPDALEPFGRAVVEAWAAGLELIVNRNVGCLHYIRNDQPALRTAGQDFWDLVLR